MAKILTPLINSNNLSIKNSFELIDKISNFKINDNDLMLSFDVVSLFSKIPVHIAKSVIFERLKCDSELKIRCKLNINEIMNALDLCLDNTYLCFRKKFYRQIFGVAMGSPISVIVANLVMESIENKMLKDFASPLSQTLFGNPKGPVELGNPNTCAETKLCLNFILFRLKK